MRYLILVAILLISIGSFSQKNRIGLSASPGLAFRVFNEKSTLGESFGKRQVPKFGYSITASYERNFRKHASFFTGVSYINNGYQSEKSSLRFSNQILPRGGFVNPTVKDFPYHSIRSRYNYHQIGIPVGVNYFIPYKGVKFFLNLGLSANYLINVRYRNILYANEGKNGGSIRDDNAEFYKDFNFSAFAGFGIEFNLNEKYVTRIFPNLSYTFTNIMDDRIIYKIYPTSSGIGVGVWRSL